MRPTRYGFPTSFAVLAIALALPLGTVAQTQATPGAPKSAARIAAAGLPTATSKGPSEAPSSRTTTEAKPVDAKGDPPSTKKPGEERVTMHGHWIVDLRNADGTLAEHRDFENSLQTPADLLFLIAGQYVAGDLGITIQSTGSYVCSANSSGVTGPLGSCLVAQSPDYGLGGFTGCAAASAGFCNYTLTTTFTGPITLTGTMPVLASGSVTGVGTVLMACNSGGTGTLSTIDAIGCYNQTEGGGYFYNNLTAAGITPLNVTTGQTILFTVALSFS